jgi:CheY-like chemotaxis protein
VKIYSEPGHGTTVRIYLPRTSAAAAELATCQKVIEQLPAGSIDQLILVVEDEAGVRRLTVDALRELGYTVRHAGCGADALRLLDELGSVTLLFTDVVMPGMSGRELADRVRAERPDLKVLFTTGYTRNAIVHNGVLDSDAELLMKPFTVDQLAHKMHRMLKGS